MSKKLILILIVALISLSIITVVSANNYGYLFGRKQVLFPKDVVKLFIENSLKGNEDLVAEVVTDFPNSYFRNCGSEELNVDEESVNNIRFKPNKLETKNDKIEKIDNSSDKFLKYVNSNDKSTLPFLEARYLFTQRSIISNFAVIETKVYKDEAIVNVEYSISNKITSNSDFYLKKDENGWKIFLVLSKNSTEYLKDDTYAQEEKGCK